ncbi:hypothetical protein GBA52_001117 [Prunus armeniaca]|nr:hypothetical protein GBA52_001117 [Prunus armeniaca]
MSTSPSSLPWLFLFLFLSALFRSSQADVGSAAHYSPPYLPTACRGSDPSQFPSSNLFGSAGEGIWDNGAACGRQYLVRCISAPVLGTCVPGEDDSDKDCGSSSLFGVPAFKERYYHGPLHHGLRCNRQLFC